MPDAAQLFQHTGGGFRDFTRIAGSSPEMWRDICIANRDPILAALDGYLSDLEAVRGMVEAQRRAGARREIHHRAQRAREVDQAAVSRVLILLPA